MQGLFPEGFSGNSLLKAGVYVHAVPFSAYDIAWF